MERNDEAEFLGRRLLRRSCPAAYRAAFLRSIDAANLSGDQATCLAPCHALITRRRFPAAAGKSGGAWLAPILFPRSRRARFSTR